MSDFPRGGTLSTALKRSKHFGQALEKKPKLEEGPLPTLLTTHDLNNNSLCLASIMRVYKNRIRLSLPHNHFAYAHVPEARAIFRSGQFVSCAPSGSSTSSKWQNVSVMPRDVNRFLGRVQPGCVLVGVVIGAEDHGFSVDLGLSDFVGFIGRKSKELSPGAYIMAGVAKVVGRVASLVKIDDNLAVDGENVFFQNLTPGTKLNLDQSKFVQHRDGLSYTHNGLNVFVNKQNTLEMANSLPSSSKNKVKLAIIYVNEATKIVYASALPSHLNLRKAVFDDEHPKWKRGIIVRNARVDQVRKMFAVLKTRDGVACFLKTINQQNPSVGQKVECRVLDVNGFDGVLVVSTKAKHLKKDKPFSVGDLKIGQKIDVSQIKNESDAGAVVSVSKQIRGFIPKAHMTDETTRVLKNGLSCRMRVLDLRIGSSDSIDKIVLTANAGMMSAKNLKKLLREWNAGGPVVVPAVVIQTLAKHRGALIASFGNIRGRLLPSTDESYRIGQFVFCERQISVELNQEDVIFKRTADPYAETNFEFGRVYELVVADIDEDSISLRLEEDGGVMKCRRTQDVFDFPELSASVRSLRKMYPLGSRAKCVCVGNDFDGCGLGMMRPLVVDWFETNGVVCGEPKLEGVVCCVVVKVKDSGILMEVLEKDRPRVFIHHSYVNWTALTEGQTIFAEIDRRKGEWTYLSMRRNERLPYSRQQMLDWYLSELSLVSPGKTELFKEIDAGEIRGEFKVRNEEGFEVSDVTKVIPVHFDEHNLLHCVPADLEPKIYFRHGRFSIVKFDNRFGYILPETTSFGKTHKFALSDGVKHSIFEPIVDSPLWSVVGREMVDGFDWLVLKHGEKSQRVLFSKHLENLGSFRIVPVTETTCTPLHVKRRVLDIEPLEKLSALITSVRPLKGLCLYLSNGQIGHVPPNYCCRTIKQMDSMSEMFRKGQAVEAWTLLIENHNIICSLMDPGEEISGVCLGRLLRAKSRYGRKVFIPPYRTSERKAFYPPTEFVDADGGSFVEIRKCFMIDGIGGWFASSREIRDLKFYALKVFERSVVVVDSHRFEEHEVLVDENLDVRRFIRKYDVINCEREPISSRLKIDLVDSIVKRAICEVFRGSSDDGERIMKDVGVRKFTLDQISRLGKVGGIVDGSSGQQQQQQPWFRGEIVVDDKPIVIDQDVCKLEEGKTSKFEQMVALEPDNVFNWVRLIASELDVGNVDNARSIARRSLRAFRNEEHKLALWLASLNIEIRFGQNLWASFGEALANLQNHTSLHRKLLQLLVSARKIDDANECVQRMIKAFPDDKEVLSDALGFFYSENCVEAGRRFLDKVLTTDVKSRSNLRPAEQVDLISKCGSLEFQYGDANQGKVLFEKILLAHPKRIDVWAVYIAALLKREENRAAKIVYDRLMELRPTKKLDGIRKQFGDVFN